MTSLFARSNFDWSRYLKSLKYALFVMRKPLTGFWDLIHEGYGTMAAAHTIVIAYIMVQVIARTMTNFQFWNVNMETFNIVMVVLQIIIPLFLWCIANWSLTTLFEGKGKLSQIYMGVAYAMTPLVIIEIFLVFLSHVLTAAEGQIYFMLLSFSMLWFIVLVLCAMKEIHDYSFAKAIATSLVTIIAIGVIVFILVMFFAVISDGVAYIMSLVQEIMFRFN